MNQYHLDISKNQLAGPTLAQIETCNQWAATALDKYHKNSEAEIIFEIDEIQTRAKLEKSFGSIDLN